MKNRPVRAKLFQPDRQMDMMQLVAAFHNFSNTLKTVHLQDNRYKTKYRPRVRHKTFTLNIF